MALGDVVNEITNIGAGANMDFQPAAGVEVLITAFGGAALGANPVTERDVTVFLYDGALASTIWMVDMVQSSQPLRLFINNTHYLRINNRSAGAVDLCFSGVQTK